MNCTDKLVDKITSSKHINGTAVFFDQLTQNLSLIHI